MKISSDITRCRNNECLQKDNCLRFIRTLQSRVWITKFKPVNGKCEHQIKKTKL